MAWFAPALGVIAASAASRPLAELWHDAAALARAAVQAAEGTGATLLLFPFDDAVVAEAAGRQVDWNDDGPVLVGPSVDDLAARDVEAVLRSARVPVAVAATSFLATQVPVAALVPSPRRLVAQVGGDPGDDDDLDVASDLVTGFARRLLEARATVLVVVVPEVDGSADATSLRRLGGHFGADVLVAGGGETEVAVVPVGDPGAGPGPAPPGVRLVLTDRPVRPGPDLATTTRLAAAAAEGGC